MSVILCPIFILKLHQGHFRTTSLKKSHTATNPRYIKNNITELSYQKFICLSITLSYIDDVGFKNAVLIKHLRQI